MPTIASVHLDLLVSKSYLKAILCELKWHFIHRSNVSPCGAPFILSQEIIARLKWMNVSASLVEMEAPALMTSTRSAANVLQELQVFKNITVTVFCLRKTAQISTWPMIVGGNFMPTVCALIALFEIWSRIRFCWHHCCLVRHTAYKEFEEMRR